MRNIRQALALLVLTLVSHAALSQFSLSMQMNKPEKPVVGLPYSADMSVRIVQHLANGMPIKNEVKGHVYRSADGLERYDVTVASTDPAHPDPITVVYILDRTKRTAVLLNSKLMTSTVEALPATATVSVKCLPLDQPRFQNQVVKPENLTTTDLSKRTQGMITLVGKRVTGTIPAGKIGNDEPLSVTADVWVDPQLKLIVQEVEENPLAGERTLELSNIRGEEPDPALFETPHGYMVKERSSLLGGMPSLLSPPQPSPKTPEQITKQIEDALKNPDPRVKNSVAYALAQSNDHLSDAQALAEEAVKLEEQETADVASKGDNELAFKQSVVLTSYWDTLGWVYYREGKQKEAETYLRAAWELKPNPEYGIHLGSIYEAQRRPKDAVAIYRMSLSAKNSLEWQDRFQTLLGKLGVPHGEPLAIEVITPLPALDLHSGDTEPLVEILIAHEGLPAVTYLKGDPTLQKTLTPAIQSALAKSLPDSGPETILRRANVSCAAGQTSPCELHFLTSDKAEPASATAELSKQ